MGDVYTYMSDDMGVHVGIVLHCIAEKSRIIILDRALGKFTAICFTTVSAGSCITYQRHISGNAIRIAVQEIVYVPLVFARSHIIFLHQLFEICNISLPVEAEATEVFELLLWVITRTHAAMSEYDQSLILVKLFTLLGLHTDRRIICESCIVLIHMCSVDTMSSITLDSKCAEMLRSWLYYSLSEQLSEQCLKTRVFFKKE